MMAKRVPESFKDLKLNVNDVFNIEPLSSKKRYPVRLIGYTEKKSVLVSVPRLKGKDFLLNDGALLRVRLIADNYACGFETRVLASHNSPYLYMHLEYPRTLEAVAVRKASRVRMSLPVEISEQEEGAVIGKWPRNETIVDVSNTGARVQSLHPLAPVGSEVILKFSVTVDTIERKLEVPAIIRNIAEVTDPHMGEAYQYGVQFESLSDDDRVYICGFVYERMLYPERNAKVDLSKNR